jgi:hypothetical protein
LSPVQQGMLFHSLIDPESGAYLQQLSCKFSGDFDAERFKHAWQELTDRNPILRTAVIPRDGQAPLQVVIRGVTLRWDCLDWSDCSAAEQQQKLDDYFQKDRALGFGECKYPLMRMGLFHLGEGDRFYWSFHHLLLDGWSTSVLMSQLFTIYEALGKGREITIDKTRPFKDYISWLLRQDLSKAEQYWKATLEGFTAPNRLKIDKGRNAGANGEGHRGELRAVLAASATAALQSLAQHNHITLNTVIQGAWALVLSRYSGNDDVVFGVITSGRPSDLPGIERMVGLFINTLPVRIRIEQGSFLLPWLKKVQEQLVEMNQFGFSPLVEVQQWSNVGSGLPLFETALVFENYPVTSSISAEERGFTIENVRSVDPSHYPINVTAGPGNQLTLQISYDAARFDSSAMEEVLAGFERSLDAVAAQPNVKLSEIISLMDEESIRMRKMRQKNIGAARRRALEKSALKPAGGIKTPEASRI